MLNPLGFPHSEACQSSSGGCDQQGEFQPWILYHQNSPGWFSILYFFFRFPLVPTWYRIKKESHHGEFWWYTLSGHEGHPHSLLDGTSTSWQATPTLWSIAIPAHGHRLSVNYTRGARFNNKPHQWLARLRRHLLPRQH